MKNAKQIASLLQDADNSLRVAINLIDEQEPNGEKFAEAITEVDCNLNEIRVSVEEKATQAA